jgi:hypothetical protein
MVAMMIVCFTMFVPKPNKLLYLMVYMLVACHFHNCSDDDDDYVQVDEVNQDAKATTTDTTDGTDSKASTVSTAIASSGGSGATSNSVSFNEDNNMDIVYDSKNNSSDNNSSSTDGIMDDDANDDHDVQVAEVSKMTKSCTNRKATPHVSRRKSMVSYSYNTY